LGGILPENNAYVDNDHKWTTNIKKKRRNKMCLPIFMSSLEVWLLPAVKYNPINNKLSQLWLYGLDAISSLKKRIRVNFHPLVHKFFLIVLDNCIRSIIVWLYSEYLTIIWSLSFFKVVERMLLRYPTLRGIFPENNIVDNDDCMA
jgi:hypothetical protein